MRVVGYLSSYVMTVVDQCNYFFNDWCCNQYGGQKNKVLLVYFTHRTFGSWITMHCNSVLCAKADFASFDNIIAKVTKKKNLTSLQVLNKCNFDALLHKVNLSNRCFLTDLCQHFIDLNVKLQGAIKTIIAIVERSRAFKAKL